MSEGYFIRLNISDGSMDLVSSKYWTHSYRIGYCCWQNSKIREDKYSSDFFYIPLDVDLDNDYVFQMPQSLPRFFLKKDLIGEKIKGFKRDLIIKEIIS